jgi:flagellar basal body-associated protein FliL
MMFSKFANKKTILIAIASIIIVVVAVVSAIYVLDTNKSSDSGETKASTKQLADDMTKEGMHLVYDDPDLATEKFLQAKAKYQELEDTAGLVDVEMHLQLIEYQKTLNQSDESQ